jgi:hypothetical protein
MKKSSILIFILTASTGLFAENEITSILCLPNSGALGQNVNKPVVLLSSVKDEKVIDPDLVMFQLDDGKYSMIRVLFSSDKEGVDFEASVNQLSKYFESKPDRLGGNFADWFLPDSGLNVSLQSGQGSVEITFYDLPNKFCIEASKQEKQKAAEEMNTEP